MYYFVISKKCKDLGFIFYFRIKRFEWGKEFVLIKFLVEFVNFKYGNYKSNVVCFVKLIRLIVDIWEVKNLFCSLRLRFKFKLYWLYSLV